MFDETEAWLSRRRAKETEVAAHTRRSSRPEEVLPDNVPVEVVEHRIPENELDCPVCGTTMMEIGKDVRRTLVMIPAQVKIREDVYFTYACPKCKEEGTEPPIRKAERLPALIPDSYASPEAVAHIMVQKFVMHVPLYRQEKEWNRAGVQLSRQPMRNWVLRVAEDWLKPVYEELHRRLLQRQVLHADETTLQVLKLEGRAARSKCYMWLYRTSGDAKSPVVLYEYRPTRRAENAAAFLESFSGWLHADGYSGYHRLPKNIRVVGCWAYLRRKFDEAVDALPKDQRAGCAAPEGLDNASSGLSRNWQGCRRKHHHKYRIAYGQTKKKEKNGNSLFTQILKSVFSCRCIKQENSCHSRKGGSHCPLKYDHLPEPDTGEQKQRRRRIDELPNQRLFLHKSPVQYHRQAE